MAEPEEIERGLQALAAELKRLEGEFNMYFSGQMTRPPHESRTRVSSLIKRLDKTQIDSLTHRYRFGSLQTRYNALAELWERKLRAREEGRQGPLARRRDRNVQPTAPQPETAERIVSVVALADPLKEGEKLQALYEAIADARRESGEQAVPFHRFAQLVRDEVERLRESGAPQVAFRVAIKEGKVKLTAKGLRGLNE